MASKESTERLTDILAPQGMEQVAPIKAEEKPFLTPERRIAITEQLLRQGFRQSIAAADHNTLRFLFEFDGCPVAFDICDSNGNVEIIAWETTHPMRKEVHRVVHMPSGSVEALMDAIQCGIRFIETRKEILYRVGERHPS